MIVNILYCRTGLSNVLTELDNHALSPKSNNEDAQISRSKHHEIHEFGKYQYNTYTSDTLSNQEELNNRPIIGILAQECLPYFPAEICNTSYIAASYVKYVESAGARVVPVLINQPEDYYRTIFTSTNGLLLPGGDVSLTDSGKFAKLFGFML